MEDPGGRGAPIKDDIVFGQQVANPHTKAAKLFTTTYGRVLIGIPSAPTPILLASYPTRPCCIRTAPFTATTRQTGLVLRQCGLNEPPAVVLLEELLLPLDHLNVREVVVEEPLGRRRQRRKVGLLRRPVRSGRLRPSGEGHCGQNTRTCRGYWMRHYCSITGTSLLRSTTDARQGTSSPASHRS